MLLAVVRSQIAGLIGVSFKRKLDEAVDQVRVADSTGLPELWIHADGGESRHGIDLVDQQTIGATLKKEVDPGQA